MKKILAIIIIGAALLLLFGCPKKDDGTKPPVTELNGSAQPNASLNASANVTGGLAAEPCAESKNVLEKDGCLKELAAARGNRSICSGIYSVDTKDECLYSFVTEGSAVCDEMGSLDRKDACLEANAKREKSLKLCDRISGKEVRERCVAAVSPPCAAVLDRAEKETCLAIAARNLSACGSEECVFSYGVQLKEPAACDAIEVNAKKYACRSLANNTIRCNDLTYATDRDYCFQLVAYEKNDTGYCDMISAKSAYSNDCYTNLAIKMGKPGYCNLLTLEDEQNNCRLEYSVGTGNSSVCESITYYRSSMRKDSCYRSTAIKYNNPSTCNGIAPGAERTNCYSLVLSSELPFRLEDCAAVDNDAWKDTCYYRVAVQTGNRSVCDSIASETAKLNCVGKFVQ